MPLLEIQTVNKITVTVALDESIAQKVDQYALFINAPSDEVVSKALDYVFSKDKDFLSFAQSVDGKKPEHPLRVRKPMEAAERAKRGRRSTPPVTPPAASVTTPKDK
jgi:hypothetical protein